MEVGMAGVPNSFLAVDGVALMGPEKRGCEGVMKGGAAPAVRAPLDGVASALERFEGVAEAG